MKSSWLEDLDEGDLKFYTDFRSVYATLLESWLHVPSQEILLGQYDTLPLLKASGIRASSQP